LEFKNLSLSPSPIKTEKFTEDLRWERERLQRPQKSLKLLTQTQLLNFTNDKPKPKQLTMESQIQKPPILTIPSQLNQLPTVLKGLAPADNQTAQLITYALIATAVVGIFVYHYIKNQEQDN
jgi:hypothetical protein